MTAFELVFSLLTIITSLALTHLLSGFVAVLRNAERVQFSALHGLWAWTAFTLAIGNWASFWSMRALTSWPTGIVLLSVMTIIAQYVFCALVTPELAREGEVDLADFHRREYRRYSFAAIVLFLASLALNFALGGAHFYEEWWRDSVITIAFLMLTVLAFFNAAAWAQTFAATALAALSTYYLVIVCDFVVA